ncbi:MAG: ABC1 kinase family protein [Betaproteobacteria bacterium]|jgi:ubiquinone biosynthesis protein|nr:ubiquinone biosynthesis protein UbiB [Rhodocyclaceae bacterium]MCE2898888.1 AarF/UbiB family protein [Betaproteobacteria bacterium]
MLLETLHAMRDLPRLRELAGILVRHGFGDAVNRSGTVSVLERAGELLVGGRDPALAGLDPPVRVRMALEAMGPTFVKLGQVLATRVDLFAPDWIAEFEKLQTAVPPVPFAELLPELEKALGASPHEVFRDLDERAHAAASIAQVHRARLPDGTAVVLKIRRPGIRTKIDADLRILGYIAAVAQTELPELARFQPVEMVAQFGRSLNRELDLAAEARGQDRFAHNFASDPTIVIPRIHWQHTSAVMNVQDYVEGVPGNDLELVERAGLDRKILARRGADAVLKMILRDGFFHADPHPGNVFYLPGNRLCIIDFGMTGRLSPSRRDQIVDLLAALSRRDEQGMMEVLLDWTASVDVDEARLANDLGELVFTYEHLSLQEIRLGQLLSDITAIMRDHHIVLPSDLTLLFKALISVEGLGRQLDPEFHLVDHLRPFVRAVILDRYQPGALAKRVQHSLSAVISALQGLPGDVSRLLRDARRGRMKIELDLKRLDHFGRQLDRSSNRLTLGVVTAALIVGSSIVMTVKGGPELLGLPVFGLLGFLIAAVNGLWIMWSIFRSGRD